MTPVGVLMVMKEEEGKGQGEEKQRGSRTSWRGPIGAGTDENSLPNTSREGKANYAFFFFKRAYNSKTNEIPESIMKTEKPFRGSQRVSPIPKCLNLNKRSIHNNKDTRNSCLCRYVVSKALFTPIFLRAWLRPEGNSNCLA